MNNNNKQIHIVGWDVSDKGFGVTKPYLEYFSQFGEVNILTPKAGTVETDLIVLPGGPDINPIHYGNVPSFYTGNGNMYKEFFFMNNLHQYIKQNTPIFGICLGMQMLNVHFEGTLYQDFAFEYSLPRSKRMEDVDFTSESIVQKHSSQKNNFNDNTVFVKNTFKINSIHHQGIFEDNLSKELITLVNSHDHGNIEAFKHQSLPIVGVQWHPEEINDTFSNTYIKNLLNIKNNE